VLLQGQNVLTLFDLLTSSHPAADVVEVVILHLTNVVTIWLLLLDWSGYFLENLNLSLCLTLIYLCKPRFGFPLACINLSIFQTWNTIYLLPWIRNFTKYLKAHLDWQLSKFLVVSQIFMGQSHSMFAQRFDKLQWFDFASTQVLKVSWWANDYLQF
jgi:hypothetical protein